MGEVCDDVGKGEVELEGALKQRARRHTGGRILDGAPDAAGLASDERRRSSIGSSPCPCPSRRFPDRRRCA